MTIARVGTLGSNTQATTSLLTCTISGGTPGNRIVARIALDNSGASGAGPTLTITDPTGNVWQTHQLSVRDPGAANAGACVYVASAQIQTAYSSTQIQFAFSVTPPCSAVLLDEWSGLAGFRSSFSNSGGVSPITNAPSPTSGDLVLCAAAIEGNAADVTGFDTDTTNGSWATSGTLQAGSSGTATSNQTLAYQHKIVTATGAQSWDVTLGTARDWASLGIVMRPAQVQSTAGGMTPGGAVAKQTSKPVVGGLTPQGAITRLVAKALTAGMTPGGTVTKQVTRSLAGGITPTGALTPTKIPFGTTTPKSVGGGMTPSGSTSKLITKSLGGGITPGGTLVKQTQKRVGGGLTPAGTVRKLTTRALAGAMTPSGLLTKRSARTLIAGLTPAGLVQKQTAKIFAGQIGGGGGAPTITTPTITSKNAKTNTGTNQIVSDAFTPSNSSLLVVYAAAQPSGSQNGTTNDMNITDSAGLTWTPRLFLKNSSAANFYTPIGKIWTAPVATGVSMTVTVTMGNGISTDGFDLSIVEASHYDIGTPIGATANADIGTPTSADGAQSVTLSGSPATTSQVLGFLLGGDNGDNTLSATPGSTFTEIHDLQCIHGLQLLEVERRTGSTSTTVDWQDVDDVVGATLYEAVGAALEIRGAPAPTIIAENGSSSGTVTKPAGGTTGDIYVIVMRAEDAPSAENLSVSGFTELLDDGVDTGGTGQEDLWFGWRVHDGTEGASFSMVGHVGGHGESMWCGLVRGADVAQTPIVATITTVNAAGASPLTVTGLTTAVANNLCLIGMASWPALATFAATGWAVEDVRDSNSFGVLSKTFPSSGATGTVDIVHGTGTGPKAASMMAFAPATGGGGSTLSGSLTPVKIPGGTVFTQSVAGTLAPAGALVKQTTKTLAGAVVPSGAATKLVSRALAGTLGSSGTVVKRVAKNPSGSLTPTGQIDELVTRSLAGTITPHGAVVKQTSRVVSGGITPHGAVTKLIAKTIAGALTPAGQLSNTKNFAITVGGTLGSSGSVTKQISTTKTSTLTTSGSLTKVLARQLAGAVAPAGSLTRTTAKTVAGQIAPTGSLVRVVTKTIAAGLTPAGTITRQTAKNTSGSLAGAGNLSKTTDLRLGGSIAPTGFLGRLTAKAVGGQLVPSGTVVKFVSRLLTGEIVPAGTLATQHGNQITLTANLTPHGDISTRVSRTLSSTIAPAGDVSAVVARRLTATLGMSGSLVQVAAKTLTATVGSSGSIDVLVSKALRGELVPVGQLVTSSLTRTLTGQLTMSGSLTTLFIPGTPPTSGPYAFGDRPPLAFPPGVTPPHVQDGIAREQPLHRGTISPG